jgi:hypothetical protein
MPKELWLNSSLQRAYGFVSGDIPDPSLQNENARGSPRALRVFSLFPL